MPWVAPARRWACRLHPEAGPALCLGNSAYWAEAAREGRGKGQGSDTARHRNGDTERGLAPWMVRSMSKGKRAAVCTLILERPS